MDHILKEINKIGIIPVVVIDDKKDAVPLADALCKGGLACAEVTFRTPKAAEAIRLMKEKYPKMLIGAGTVLTIDQVKQAVEAGAEFIVSPGFDPEIVDYCIENKIVVLPGCVTPSEVTMAIRKGLEAIKFFPAQQAGGLPYIKAISAPFSSLFFIPTGGIHAGNIREYLEYDRILACGGSWMVKRNLVSEGRFEEIEKLTKEAAEIVKEIRG